MAERKQVQDPNEGGTALRPQASPVDTFVQSAARPSAEALGIDSFSQTVKALQKFNPDLQKFLREEGKRYTEEELAEGVAAFNKNREDFAEAVRKGIIPAGASPHFQRGYRQSQLKVKGLTFDASMRDAYIKSPAANSDDPNEFSEWVRGYTADYHKSQLKGFTDAEIAETFAPLVARSQNVLFQRHTERRAAEVERQRMQATGQLFDGIMSNFQAVPVDPSSTAGKEAMLGLSVEIRDEMQALIEDGMLPTKVNELVIDTVVAKARGTNDLGLLDVLNAIQSGTGSLGSTKRAREKVEAARDHILAEQERLMGAERRRRKRLKEQKTDMLLSAGLEAMLEGKEQAFSQINTMLIPHDPQASNTLMAAYRAHVTFGDKVFENTETVGALNALALNDTVPLGARNNTIIRAYASRQIDEATMNTLIQRSRDSDSRRKIYRATEWRDFERNVAEWIGGFNIGGIQKPKEAVLTGQLKSVARAKLTEYMREHKLTEADMQGHGLEIAIGKIRTDMLANDPRLANLRNQLKGAKVDQEANPALALDATTAAPKKLASIIRDISDAASIADPKGEDKEGITLPEDVFEVISVRVMNADAAELQQIGSELQGLLQQQGFRLHPRIGALITRRAQELQRARQQ